MTPVLLNSVSILVGWLTRQTAVKVLSHIDGEFANIVREAPLYDDLVIDHNPQLCARFAAVIAHGIREAETAHTAVKPGSAQPS